MAKKDAAPDEREDRDKGLRKAYSTATQRLRAAHRDEFNDLMKQAASEEGIDWSPRLTEEQRAEQEFDRLVKDYPHLLHRMREHDEVDEESDEQEAAAS